MLTMWVIIFEDLIIVSVFDLCFSMKIITIGDRKSIKATRATPNKKGPAAKNNNNNTVINILGFSTLYATR